MKIAFLFNQVLAASPKQTPISNLVPSSGFAMKRLVLLAGMFGLTACHRDPIEPTPTCYDCVLVAASASNSTIVRQTSTFCSEAEKNQFIQAHQNDPLLQLLECKNRGF